MATQSYEALVYIAGLLERIVGVPPKSWAQVSPGSMAWVRDVVKINQEATEALQQYQDEMSSSFRPRSLDDDVF